MEPEKILTTGSPSIIFSADPPISVAALNPAWRKTAPPWARV